VPARGVWAIRLGLGFFWGWVSKNLSVLPLFGFACIPSLSLFKTLEPDATSGMYERPFNPKRALFTQIFFKKRRRPTLSKETSA